MEALMYLIMIYATIVFVFALGYILEEVFD